MSGPQMKFGVVMLGSKDLVNRLNISKENIKGALRVGVYNLGLAILAPAVRNAPKRWGVLRGSGYVTLPRGTSCRVGFGGPASAYAWVQHERTDYKHREGGAKYLLRAVQEVMPRSGDIVLDAVQRSLQAGRVPRPPVAVAPTTPWQGPRQPRKGKGKGKGKRSRPARRRR